MGGFQGYKEHAFFTGLDWGQLEKKALIPPFVPDPKKVNFDATHELEELLLEDNPLTQQQKRKYSDAPRTLPNGDPLPQDWITLEEKFKVYDYTKPYVTDMSGATVLNPPEGQPAPDNAVSSQPPTTAGSFLGESLRRISLGTKGSKKAAATKQQRSNLALVPRAREAETESLHRDVMEGREEEVMAEGNNKDATSTKDGGESAHEKSITSLPGDGSAKRRESVSPPQERNAIPEESA